MTAKAKDATKVEQPTTPQPAAAPVEAKKAETQLSKAQVALQFFQTKLKEIRGIATVTKIEEAGGGFVVTVAADWPVVKIGRNGGFGLPDISSYPETGKGSSYTYPGNSALDAALFGDKYLAKKLGRMQAKAAASVKAPEAAKVA